MREVWSQGELCLQDRSARGFSAYLCLIVLSKGDCCTQGQTLTLGANFAHRWRILPQEVNFVPREDLCTQGRALPPGANIAPGADCPKVEFCFQRLNLPTGANFAPGGKLQTVLSRVDFLTRGEVGSQSPIKSRTWLTCALSRFFLVLNKWMDVQLKR